MDAMQEIKVGEINVEEEIKNCPIEPVFERVIVKELEVEAYGSLFVPESARGGEMQTNEGIIIAVGDEVPDFKAGDHVYYGRYSGAWCKIRGTKYRFMNREDIMGRFKSNV